MNILKTLVASVCETLEGLVEWCMKTPITDWLAKKLGVYEEERKDNK